MLIMIYDDYYYLTVLLEYISTQIWLDLFYIPTLQTSYYAHAVI